MTAKELRDYRKANKLCPYCGDPALFLESMCQKHKEERAKRNAIHQANKRRLEAQIRMKQGGTLESVAASFSMRRMLGARTYAK